MTPNKKEINYEFAVIDKHIGDVNHIGKPITTEFILIRNIENNSDLIDPLPNLKAKHNSTSHIVFISKGNGVLNAYTGNDSDIHCFDSNDTFEEIKWTKDQISFE